MKLKIILIGIILLFVNSNATETIMNNKEKIKYYSNKELKIEENEIDKVLEARIKIYKDRDIKKVLEKRTNSASDVIFMTQTFLGQIDEINPIASAEIDNIKTDFLESTKKIQSIKKIDKLEKDIYKDFKNNNGKNRFKIYESFKNNNGKFLKSNIPTIYNGLENVIKISKNEKDFSKKLKILIFDEIYFKFLRKEYPIVFNTAFDMIFGGGITFPSKKITVDNAIVIMDMKYNSSYKVIMKKENNTWIIKDIIKIKK